VQKGDTAGSIARLHSVSLKDLISANGLNKRAGIVIGQNLQIPARDKLRVAKNKPVTTRLGKRPKKKIAAKENRVSFSGTDLSVAL